MHICESGVSCLFASTDPATGAGGLVLASRSGGRVCSRLLRQVAGGMDAEATMLSCTAWTRACKCSSLLDVVLAAEHRPFTRLPGRSCGSVV